MASKENNTYNTPDDQSHYNNQTSKRHVDHLTLKHGSVCDQLGSPFKIFSKYVQVFDLYFVATARCPDAKVLHGAAVLYQYIDNTDNGLPDNELVYVKLHEMKATMVMFYDSDELDEHGEFFDEVCTVETV